MKIGLLLFVYFLVNVFLVSLLVYFFNILQYCLVSYIIKENLIFLQNLGKGMACCTPKDLHCDFLCQFRIEILLSIMWNSVADILWFLKKKSFLFLPAFLHNSTINVKLFVNVYRLSRGCSVTYLGISFDVKIRG